MVAVEVERPATARRVTGVDVAVIGGTFALWGVIMALAARSAGISAWPTSSWGRWDTGLYLQIADSGYVLERCEGIANRGPDDWCGTSGWFPGYPYAMRGASLFGFRFDAAGRIISLTAMLVAYSTLWFGFVRQRPIRSGVLAMAVAATFPASVYYGAIFPVSTMIGGALLALVCLDRRQWLAAGCFGALATVVYPSGVVLGVLALVPLTATCVGDLRARVRAALMVGAPIVLAYLIVLLNFQRAVGAWDAWFKTAASYRYEPTFPGEMIIRKVRHLGNDGIPGAIGVQTLLVVALMIAASWVVWTNRHDLSLGERGAAIAMAALWVMPLTLGGDLSLYRAESLLLPVVILLSRLRPAALVAFVAVAIPVSFLMAELFFKMVLM